MNHPWNFYPFTLFAAQARAKQRCAAAPKKFFTALFLLGIALYAPSLFAQDLPPLEDIYREGAPTEIREGDISKDYLYWAESVADDLKLLLKETETYTSDRRRNRLLLAIEDAVQRAQGYRELLLMRFTLNRALYFEKQFDPNEDELALNYVLIPAIKQALYLYEASDHPFLLEYFKSDLKEPVKLPPYIAYTQANIDWILSIKNMSKSLEKRFDILRSALIWVAMDITMSPEKRRAPTNARLFWKLKQKEELIREIPLDEASYLLNAELSDLLLEAKSALIPEDNAPKMKTFLNAQTDLNILWKHLLSMQNALQKKDALENEELYSKPNYTLYHIMVEMNGDQAPLEQSPWVKLASKVDVRAGFVHGENKIDLGEYQRTNHNGKSEHSPAIHIATKIGPATSALGNEFTFIEFDGTLTSLEHAKTYNVRLFRLANPSFRISPLHEASVGPVLGIYEGAKNESQNFYLRRVFILGAETRLASRSQRFSLLLEANMDFKGDATLAYADPAWASDAWLQAQKDKNYPTDSHTIGQAMLGAQDTKTMELKATCQAIHGNFLFECVYGRRRYRTEDLDGNDPSDLLFRNTPYATQDEILEDFGKAALSYYSSNGSYEDFDRARVSLGLNYEFSENASGKTFLSRFNPTQANDVFTKTEAWYFYWKIEY